MFSEAKVLLIGANFQLVNTVPETIATYTYVGYSIAVLNFVGIALSALIHSGKRYLVVWDTILLLLQGLYSSGEWEPKS